MELDFEKDLMTNTSELADLDIGFDVNKVSELMNPVSNLIPSLDLVPVNNLSSIQVPNPSRVSEPVQVSRQLSSQVSNQVPSQVPNQVPNQVPRQITNPIQTVRVSQLHSPGLAQKLPNNLSRPQNTIQPPVQTSRPTQQAPQAQPAQPKPVTFATPIQQTIPINQVDEVENSLPVNCASSATPTESSSPALVATAATVSALTAGSSSLVLDTDYFNIFGFDLSKTTIYIAIGFIILVVGYYLYTYFYSSKPDKSDKLDKSDKSDKRTPEVSFKEQTKSKKSDDKNESSD